MAKPITAAAAPEMFYDGVIFWYVERFDPAEDLCCFCRQPIGEYEVPLILFNETAGGFTYMSRIHSEALPGHDQSCSDKLFASGHIQIKR